MKKVHASIFITALKCFILALPAEAGSLMTQSYDSSSPEAVFRACGLAISNNNPQAFYNAIGGDAKNMIPYDEFLKRMWDHKTPQGTQDRLLNSDYLVKTGKLADYFLQARFLQEHERLIEEEVEIRMYWVKWDFIHLIRKETFFQFKGSTNWCYLPDPYAHTSERIAQESYATPTNAFRAIRQAQFMRLETEVCRGLATAARGGMDVEKCSQMLRLRLSKLSKGAADDVWINSMLTACSDCLEEEFFTEKDGSQRCRVWETEKDTGGKRVRRRYELFIKEGNEWKWLPAAKSFWNIGAWEATPAKQQDK